MAALQSALGAVRGALEGGEPPSPHLLNAININKQRQGLTLVHFLSST